MIKSRPGKDIDAGRLQMPMTIVTGPAVSHHNSENGPGRMMGLKQIAQVQVGQDRAFENHERVRIAEITYIASTTGRPARHQILVIIQRDFERRAVLELAP